MSDKNRTAVIVASDLDFLEPLVESAGYDIVGVASLGVHGAHLVASLRPDAIVIENELAGEPGWQMVPRFRELSPASKVVLVTSNGWTPSETAAVGAFGVVRRCDIASVVETLRDLDKWITVHEAEGTVESERRRGRDRRVSQDWTKVGWQRRTNKRRSDR